MLVKILAGTYGYRDENGRLRPKNKGDVANVDEAEATRLIEIGIAEASDLPFSESLDIEMDNTDIDVPESKEDDAVNLEDMSFEQLKEVAERMGINTSKYRTKKTLLVAVLESIDGVPVEPEA